MSSGQHTPRRSPSLRDLSRHDLKAVLSHDQQRTADNRPVPYVARIGRDRHLVRNPGSDIVYSVGGPNYSFKPGTIVLLGSNTGRPGESIIALPSPAQRGVSAYPESRFGGSINFPAPEDPPNLEPIDPCTIGILNRSYVGLHVSGGNFLAHYYQDSVYTGNSVSVSSPFTNPQFTQFAVNGSGDEYIVGQALQSSARHVFSWNLSDNILHTVNVSPQISRIIVGPVVLGSTMYYALVFSATTITLFSLDLGSISPVTIGSVTDSTLSWSARPYIAATGAGHILTQNRKSSDPFETRMAWSNLATGQLRLTPFSEEDVWQGAPAYNVGSQALGVHQIFTGLSRMSVLSGDGTQSILADYDVVFPSSSVPVFNAAHVLSINKSKSEMSLYSSSSAIRVPIQDYNHLVDCVEINITGTEQFENMPGFATPPTVVYARD